MPPPAVNPLAADSQITAVCPAPTCPQPRPLHTPWPNPLLDSTPTRIHVWDDNEVWDVLNTARQHMAKERQDIFLAFDHNPDEHVCL